MTWCQDAAGACMFYVHLAMLARCPELRKPPLAIYYKTCKDRTHFVTGALLDTGTRMIIRESDFIAAEFCAKKGQYQAK